jgi:MFS family permease
VSECLTLPISASKSLFFALVMASFTNLYITQPVLPVLRQEFAPDMVLVSFTVSTVILGMALSNLPFGFLADRLPIHLIILTEGLFVAHSIDCRDRRAQNRHPPSNSVRLTGNGAWRFPGA